MRPLELHHSALTDSEYDEYAGVINELSPQENIVYAREVRAWFRGRYYLGDNADIILKFFTPDIKITDVLSCSQLFAALRIAKHVREGNGVPSRELAFIPVPKDSLSTAGPSTGRPLELDPSALSNDEHALFNVRAVELCDSDVSAKDMAFNVREVRGWIKGRYTRIDAKTVDTILKFFTPNLSSSDTLSLAQLYAVLRLVLHADAGKEVHEGLVFVQAPIESITSGDQITQDSLELSSGRDIDMNNLSAASSLTTISSTSSTTAPDVQQPQPPLALEPSTVPLSHVTAPLPFAAPVPTENLPPSTVAESISTGPKKLKRKHKAPPKNPYVLRSRTSKSSAGTSRTSNSSLNSQEGLALSSANQKELSGKNVSCIPQATPQMHNPSTTSNLTSASDTSTTAVVSLDLNIGTTAAVAPAYSASTPAVASSRDRGRGRPKKTASAINGDAVVENSIGAGKSAIGRKGGENTGVEGLSNGAQSTNIINSTTGNTTTSVSQIPSDEDAPGDRDVCYRASDGSDMSISDDGSTAVESPSGIDGASIIRDPGEVDNSVIDPSLLPTPHVNSDEISHVNPDEKRNNRNNEQNLEKLLKFWNDSKICTNCKSANINCALQDPKQRYNKSFRKLNCVNCQPPNKKNCWADGEQKMVEDLGVILLGKNVASGVMKRKLEGDERSMHGASGSEHVFKKTRTYFNH